MSDVSLANRLLLSETEVNPEKFKSGKLSLEDTKQVENAIGLLYNYPVYVDSNSSVTMSYIRSHCRILKKKGKCGMVIIDYLQLVSEKGDKGRNRENEVSQMSREAKLIAKELDIPVLLLSQLNRDVDKRTRKEPVLADLRESGAIEQDADMVIFIHRPEYYNANAEHGEGNLIIAKYRNGPTGLLKFKYNESMTKIYDYDFKQQSQLTPVNYHEPQNIPF
jgi:replicative DNA helicase